MDKTISSKLVALTFGILVVSFLAVFYVLAWQEPTQTPPGGNVATPLNVGLEDQIKEGNLVVNALGISATGNALLVPYGNVGIGTTAPTQKLDVSGYVKGQTGLCIGADCRTSWPGAESGTLKAMWTWTSITAPNGYTGPCYSDSACKQKLGAPVDTILVNQGGNSLIVGPCPYRNYLGSFGGGCTAVPAGKQYAICAAGLTEVSVMTGIATYAFYLNVCTTQ